MYCFKNEQECIIRFKNSMRSREFLHLIRHSREFLNGFKMSDIFQLILALIFRFAVILIWTYKKLDVNFRRVLIFNDLSANGGLSKKCRFCIVLIPPELFTIPISFKCLLYRSQSDSIIIIIIIIIIITIRDSIAASQSYLR